MAKLPSFSNSNETSNTEDEHNSVLRRLLGVVTRLVTKKPTWTLAVFAIIAIACITLTALKMDFKTNRADLIDPNAAFHQRWLNYTESFGESADIVVVVEAESPESIKEILDRLGREMENQPDHFANVLYKISPGLLKEKGLQYLTPKQLESGLEILKGYSPVLKGEWDLTTLDALFSQLNDQFTESTNKVDPVLSNQANRLCESLLKFQIDRDNFVSPWPEVLSVTPELKNEAHQVVYFLNDAGTMGFLKAFPLQSADSFGGPTAAIEKARSVINEVAIEFPAAQIGLTGIPVLESDEMARSQSDMTLASVISFVGVGLLLLIGFRGLKHPALALIMLAVGMAWAFGYTTLFVGHLNILSVSFAAILIGLGIDFAIHYLARYLELRQEGKPLRVALIETSSGVGAGILTASVTTALAFFCATFTEFLGVAELGIIAGGGILLCAVATFFVLPALIAVADRKVEPKSLPVQFQAKGLRKFINEQPIMVLLFSCLIVGLLTTQAFVFKNGQLQSAVQYDSNLLNLQAKDIESVKTQERIFEQSKGSLLYAVSVAKSVEECQALKTKYESLESVEHVRELGSHFPDHPANQTKLMVQAFRAYLNFLPAELPETQLINPGKIGRSIEQLYSNLQSRSDQSSKKTHRTLDQFLAQFETLDLQDQIALLQEYQTRIQMALLYQFREIKLAANPEPVNLSDLPRELTSRFVSPKGEWLLQVYPKQQIWKAEPLREFVHEVRTVDANVTGTPLQNFEASRQIQESYYRAALYALAIIVLVLQIDFLRKEHVLITVATSLLIAGVIGVASHYQGLGIRGEWLSMICLFTSLSLAAYFDFKNFSLVIFALIPPLAGAVMMLGLLGFLGVDFNPANLIVLPLVLGIGVDDGVHVVHDFRSQKRNYKTSASTINAILLTSLTSMIGFGSMVLASHQGLSSLGLVLVVGVGSCLFVSLVLLPAFLTLTVKPVTQDSKVRQKRELEMVGH